MPIYNAAVTSYTAVEPPPNTQIWTDQRLGYTVIRGKTLAMSCWPYQSVPPAGTECALKLVRYEDDGSLTVGPNAVVKTTDGVTSGNTQGRPFISWLSDTRIATCRNEWATQQQVAELWAVNTSTLVLTLLDQTVIGPPADGGSWSMDNGTVSEAGVVCACFNKYTPGQPQNVASPDIYQFAVCEVVGDSFGPWSRRDHVRDGYHTKWRTYPISANRFLTPWTSASGGVYESGLYDTAADTLRLVSREVSSWATAGGATPYGPGQVMDSGVIRREFMEPDQFYFRYGIWRWDGSNLVNQLQVPFIDGKGVFEEIPEHIEVGAWLFPMPDGTFGSDGDVYEDDLFWERLGFYILPDATSSEVLVGKMPEELGEGEFFLGAVGYLAENKFWAIVPYGVPTPYGAMGRLFVVIEPQEPTEIADEFEGSAARFW